MAKHLPSFQFYPGDWLKDPALRSCSPAARGIWMDLLCLMFECEPRGVLQTNGKPWTLAEIASRLDGDNRSRTKYVRELHQNGTITVLKSGAYCSKRMVRDEAIRQQNAARQAKKRVSDKKGDKLVTPMSHPSSSSSSTSVKELLSTIVPAPTKPKPKPRKDSPKTENARALGRALCAATGFVAGSRGDHARITKLVKVLIEHEAMPLDIPVRAKRFAVQWPDLKITPEALVKHWGSFAKQAAAVVDGKAHSKEGKYEKYARTN